jgi:hypothetical protein
MAIIIEEEKNGKNMNLIRFFAWLVILIIVAIAAYYLFFVKPELVIITPPANFQYIAPIAQANLDPQAVLNSPAFTALKQPNFPLPTPNGPVPVGRPNPFVSP